jgi:hypothetical protein
LPATPLKVNDAPDRKNERSPGRANLPTCNHLAASPIARPRPTSSDIFTRRQPFKRFARISPSSGEDPRAHRKSTEANRENNAGKIQRLSALKSGGDFATLIFYRS